MVRHHQRASRRLFDLAEQQQGYFTAKPRQQELQKTRIHIAFTFRQELVYVPSILAASATVIIRVIGSVGDGIKPYFS